MQELDARKRWLRVVKIPLVIVSILLLIHVFKEVSGWPIHYWGIYPRKVMGLRGIIFAPWIHGDWAHLFYNSAPLIALSLVMFYFYPRVARSSIVMVYLMTGIGVWLFGKSNFHIGASGVIYGMLSFVFWTGVFRWNVKSIVLALIILFFYQGFFTGLIPKDGVSWESHLFGALSGIFAAYFYKDFIEKDEEKVIPSWEKEAANSERYFLPRDVFEKTRRQREEELRNAEGGWSSDHTLF